MWWKEAAADDWTTEMAGKLVGGSNDGDNDDDVRNNPNNEFANNV